MEISSSYLHSPLSPSWNFYSSSLLLVFLQDMSWDLKLFMCNVTLHDSCTEVISILSCGSSWISSLYWKGCHIRQLHTILPKPMLNFLQKILLCGSCQYIKSLYCVKTWILRKSVFIFSRGKEFNAFSWVSLNKYEVVGSPPLLCNAS